LQVAGSRLRATVQTAGLNREIMRAVVPLWVGTNTAAHGTVSSACSTTEARASAALGTPCCRQRLAGHPGGLRPAPSVTAAILASMATDSSGYFPIADSATA